MTTLHRVELMCKCGKGYKHFSSYKKHFLSCSEANHQPHPSGKANYQPIQTANNFSNSQPANPNPNTSHKQSCPFCHLNINSTKIQEHITNTCQQRYKNTPEYIELSKLGLIIRGQSNKEIRAMCNVIRHLAATGIINL